MSINKCLFIPPDLMACALRYSTDQEIHHLLTTSKQMGSALIEIAQELFIDVNQKTSRSSQIGLMKWQRLNQFFPVPTPLPPLRQLFVSDRTLKNPPDLDPIPAIGRQVEEMLQRVNNFSCLTHLSLKTATIREEQILSLVEQAPLNRVDLHYSSATGARTWEALSRKSLKSLHVDGMAIHFNGLYFPCTTIGYDREVAKKMPQPNSLPFSLTRFDYTTLHTLTFKYVSNLNDEIAKEIGPTLSLQSLYITGCDALSGPGLVPLFCPTLRELTLIGQEMGDKECVALAKNAKGIERFVLGSWFANTLSEESFKALETCHELAHLDVQIAHIVMEEVTLQRLICKLTKTARKSYLYLMSGEGYFTLKKENNGAPVIEFSGLLDHVRLDARDDT